MIDDIKFLVEQNMVRIVEHLPSACILFMDPVGSWDIADFEVVWYNKAAKEMFGSRISRGKINAPSPERMKLLTDNLKKVRQSMLEGHKGFFGPFSSTFMHDSGEKYTYNRYTMYLGEIGVGSPIFLVLAQREE